MKESNLAQLFLENDMRTLSPDIPHLRHNVHTWIVFQWFLRPFYT